MPRTHLFFPPRQRVYDDDDDVMVDTGGGQIVSVERLVRREGIPTIRERVHHRRRDIAWA